MGLTNKYDQGVSQSIVEAVGMDTLGICSSPRGKKRGMKNPLPPNTRKLRSRSRMTSSKITNQSDIEVVTEDIPASTEFHVWSNEGINLFVDLNSSNWMEKLTGESEEQTKASSLGSTSVNLNTTGNPEVIESFPSSVVKDILEENIGSSATTPKNIAESSLVRESDPKGSSLCGHYCQSSVDLSSDSHLQNGIIHSVSAGSKLSDISENGSMSDIKCPASSETVPMPALVSSKPGLPVISDFSEDRTLLIVSAIENSSCVIPSPSEPSCAEPLVEEQVVLVNNSAGSASLPDIQLDNGIQSEPPRPELPVEDQVELVNNPDLRSASQSDIQLGNGIQSEPPCLETLVEHQVELVKDSASGSVSQPDILLGNDIQCGHITSQQAEDPTHHPATEEHAELHSHDIVAPVRGTLQLPMSIGRSLGGSDTCVSDSRSMGGVPDSINHPRQSASMTSYRTSQSLHRDDPTLNESIRIGKEQGQVGLVVNSGPQPNTRLDYGIQLGHNTSRRAEFPTQPATTVEHSELPSYSDALQNTVLQMPMFVDRCVEGNGTRVSDSRSFGVVPQCFSHPLQISPLTSSRALHQDDPFSYEVAKMRREYDQAVKFHQETDLRLRFSYYMEREELIRKYRKLHLDTDLAYARTRKALEINLYKVRMNRLLAEYLKEKTKLM